MSIRRCALWLLVLSACGFQSSTSSEPVPALSETSEPVLDACDPVDAPCDPLDRFATGMCQLACGGHGHCLDHSAVERAWSAAHPDQAFAPGRRCSSSGEPGWPAHCAPAGEP